MRHAGFPIIANISLLFGDLPLLHRAGEARRHGFDAVESWWPFPTPRPRPDEVDAFVGSIEDAGISLVALNFYGGDLAAGDRGVLSWPGRQEDFLDSVRIARDIGRRTGCRLFNAPFGQRLDGVGGAEQDDIAVANLGGAARTMADIGGTVLLETLTAGENGRYPLLTMQDAAAVVERVQTTADAGAIRLLLDTYHVTNNGEDVVAVLEQYQELVSHVQVADSPGRGQPGTGSIDFPKVFDALRRCRYSGYVSCEYKPSPDREESFRWLSTQ